MANNGWVKLYRKIREWEWYHDSQMVHLLLHLIVSASHDDTRWQGMEIKRGQLVTGRKSLSEETGIPEKAIRTRLKKLELSGEIIRKTASKFSIITINNYNIYQGMDVDKGPAKGQQRATKGPQTRTKEEGKDSCANALQKRAHCTLVNGETFFLFWEAYPKKRDKLKARKAWDKIKADSELTQQILTAVSLQAKTRDWTKEDGKYIPLPTTWLNGRRWEDEIETTDTDEWQ